MRLFFKFVIGLLMLAPLGLPAQDLILEEVDLRNDPKALFNKLSTTVPLPEVVGSRDEYEANARQQGYTPEQYTHLLQRLTRVNLEPNMGNDNNKMDTNRLLKVLDIGAFTPYDKAMLLMLKGRELGRHQHKYQDAIVQLEQALNSTQDMDDLQGLLLKFTIHEQLGSLHLMLHQDVPALVSLQRLRELAYQLRNNFLIALAESEMGKYYVAKQQLTKALQHYNEAYRLSNSDDYPLQRANLQLQLARVYRDLDQTTEALQYAHDAVEGFEALGFDSQLSISFTVIAMIHANANEWNKAIDYYLNAQQVDIRAGNNIALARNFHNLGEAYINLNQFAQALEYLGKANTMLAERKLNHYLVYNEQLLAQANCGQAVWQECVAHADKAIALAVEQSLPEVQIEALEQKVRAEQATNDATAAMADQARIIGLLKQHPTKPEETEQSGSVLTEQKLKLDLALQQGQLQDIGKALDSRTSQVFAFIALSLVALIALYFLARSRRLDKRRLKRLQQQMPQDALTELPGYRGFIDYLSQPASNVQSLVLLSLWGKQQPDLELGLHRYIQLSQQQQRSLEQALDCRVFLVRPGTFLLCCHQDVEQPQQLIDTLEGQLGLKELRLGLIRLPLMANKEIRLTPQVLFETLQMALAGSLSLDSKQSIFVSLRALDFAPAAIFSPPLYLHVEKALSRGLVRIETNGDREAICWPGAAATE
ncbi:tetratricopeptide repeat protein [Shewanella cyperi]|uniref:tetratricopeptide repeat protein n=1 Tax=Shewanella cyperi TaxID=2814292 RepID=UPI001A93C6BF|nr:tetratricopeptide repeat protein [Shewanella cyperi]QSX41803.1 tetratricopeptide repeat protein [Shewanella cyperi]